MEAQGSGEEVAALSLGASGWRTFRKVTLPNVKWALLYGVILCTARVFGEFGAVSVVSGHIDSNDTMPLRIEKLWNEYNNQAAFSVASMLVFLAIVFTSPDGLLGLWGRIRPLLAQESLRSLITAGAVLRAQTQSTQGRIE